jgi:hypothetical protein
LLKNADSLAHYKVNLLALIRIQIEDGHVLHLVANLAQSQNTTELNTSATERSLLFFTFFST